MGVKKWKDIRRRLSAEKEKEAADWVAKEVTALELQELRELAGKTQVEVADELEVAQSQLSRLEQREDHRLSTLRRYVEALGGALEVVAVIGNKRITLKGV